MSLADIRTDYQRASLSEDQVNADPLKQFSIWFQEALDSKVNEPNAMSLSTADTNGRPSSRIVLIKDLDQRGITWFTHYASRKGEELAANPHAALLFFWPELERQVRIEGKVERVGDIDNDTYFNSRPLASRHGALASQQSKVIANRSLLEQRVEEIRVQHGEKVQRPDHWGGYRLVPDYFEFWQGRSSRLHDRIVFARNEHGVWERSRLQP